MFCKHCGKEIADDSTFCKFCGQKVLESIYDDIKEDDEEWHGFSDDDEDTPTESHGQPDNQSADSFFKKVVKVTIAIKEMPKGGKIVLIIFFFIILSCISSITKSCSGIINSNNAKTSDTVNQFAETLAPTIDSTPTKSPEETQAEYEKSKEELKESWNELKESLGIKTEEKPEDVPFNPADYTSAPDYEELARYPDSYKNGLYKFYGKVLQVSEGIFNTAIRLELHGDINQVVYCEVPNNLTENRRILEDDYVTMYGVYKGTTTYKTVLGARMTVPKITVTQYMY